VGVGVERIKMKLTSESNEGSEQEHVTPAMGKVGWTGQVAWETRVDDKRVTVVAQPILKAKSGAIRWAGLAIEAPASADSLSEVLRQHSHADIGDFETLCECIAACEIYIDRWHAGKVHEEPCACVEIVTEEERGSVEDRGA
jgi:hypothetical protein